VTDLSQRAANMRGIIALLIGQALFVTSDSVIKLAGDMMPATEIMAVRGLFAVAIMGAFVATTISMERRRLLFRPLVVARAVLEAFLAFLFVISLPHMPLPDITVIQQITPLVLTVLSAVVLREAVGWRRWLAVAVGFVGVALVVQPTGQGVNIYAISALLCAIFVAFRDLITRRLHDAIPTAVVTFGSTVSVCLAGFVGAPFEEWQPLSLYGIGLLVASAILVSTANMFVVRAFRGVDVSVISPFRYAAVVWATLLGFLIWGHIPNGLAIAGTLVIVATGLYTMHREALRPKVKVEVV
jgi:drug/metabolite transporter (DMT)-like permease